MTLRELLWVDAESASPEDEVVLWPFTRLTAVVGWDSGDGVDDTGRSRLEEPFLPGISSTRAVGIDLGTGLYSAQ